MPQVQDNRRQVVSADSAYQITAMMQDVIARGTGQIAGKGITRDIAGKTGTSQDFRDAWFAGFTPDIVTVVWLGFDTPQSLGKNETGGRIAGPIWNRFMKVAFEGRPELKFRVPEGITLARYDTGRLMAVDAFKADQVPGMSIALNGFGAGTEALTAADTGTDLYDTENDMATAPGQAWTTDPGGETSGGAKKLQAPNAQLQGDIGMGGLY